MVEVEDFNQCNSLFKQEKINELDSEKGDRFLKLRSLNRSKFLEKLLDKFGYDISNIKKSEQLNFAFCSDIPTNEIERFIRKEYSIARRERLDLEKQIVNELYKLNIFDWGGLHQNSLEKTIVDKYIKKIYRFNEIEQAIESDLHASLRGYVLCSWYNHWTTILIEDVIKDHKRILPALGLIPKIDFFLDNVPFDLKVTYFPEGFVSAQRKKNGLKPELTLLKQNARENEIPIDHNLSNTKQLENLWLKLEEFSYGNSITNQLREFRLQIISEIEENPKELITWLYENQGVRRFDASNRFFLILINTQNFFDSWKMKRAVPRIKETTNRFLNANRKAGHKIEFVWDGQIFSAFSEVLLIKNQ